jgi:hypothetical protein
LPAREESTECLDRTTSVCLPGVDRSTAAHGSGLFLTKHSGVYVEGDDLGFEIIAGRHGGESKVGGQVHTFRIVSI